MGGSEWLVLKADLKKNSICRAWGGCFIISPFQTVITLLRVRVLYIDVLCCTYMCSEGKVVSFPL